jgi:CRISPR-associated endonuclease/helicase Cas3
MSLWAHQQRVFEQLQQGHNVILQAPTGSGKTRAALYPFLTGMDYQSDLHNKFPRKCIYSVPMRVLAKQFKLEYEQAVIAYNRSYGLNISTSIQTGEQPEDREFASNLIFATIDQTLSSFLVNPYSLPRRKANLNAAAVLASYLVFDEFHLYDPDSTLPTTLHMLQLLKGLTPFVLMTATFSGTMLEELADLLDAAIVPGTPEEQNAILSLESQQKTRRYQVSEQPLSAETVLRHHVGRSLVICNTVDRARALYQAITDQKAADTEVLLLHSRLLKPDRERVEDTIRARFARGVNDGSLIVVSTQAIEVGLDITSKALHTELAPANAIVQRAGRCARYAGEIGDVYIYGAAQVDDEVVDLTENVMPYKSQAEQFAETLRQFRERNACTFDFAAEQAVISAVHGPRDRILLDKLQMGSYDHRRTMFSVMRGDDDPQHLVRTVLQQQVTIHANPDALLEAPFDAPSFGVHPGTLKGYVKRWIERGGELDIENPVMYLWQSKAEEASNQSNKSEYKWEQVPTPETARGAPLIVVHPLLATYDSLLGFLPDDSGQWEAELPKREERQVDNQPRYRLETYEAHINHVYRAFTELWPEMEYAARQLEQAFGWEQGSVRRAAELAVLLHDVGKLSIGWQAWVRKYQASIGESVAENQVYAHTDLRTPEHREAERHAGKRPWHAVEGAIAVSPILADNLGEDNPLVYAIFSAICRHHAAYSDSNQKFKLVKNAAQFVKLAARLPEIPTNLAGLRDMIKQDAGAAKIIAEPEAESWPTYLAYLVLVRVLRRADQLGTARGAKGEVL